MSSQYLVLTVMGPDRTGSVSNLTKLASECSCNIVDSKMAIFGLEFTMIMLLKGSAKAINQLESKLPAVAIKRDLITMMKRTSDYKRQDYTEHYQVDYAGIDQPGLLKAVTAFFATRSIDISSLKSEIDPETNHMSAMVHIALNEKMPIEELEKDFFALCEQIDVQGRIRKVTQHSL
ncbi:MULTISPECIES: glycine cleavage system protein R [Thalassotalea]|uniref:glycine cleavage system protein R n=1 Tax=Thalassotalea TaxID=1518149 RepID=UPI000942D1EE|nr:MULTISPECIES: ACT domain-containing protein [Thalassotalea]MDO6428399.1 ACT domain-containing protein [Thalassotalea sp. 1_MG-2023]OKY27102.1 transcriptional regulator [Thalassotalea sp. PP2-459]